MGDNKMTENLVQTTNDHLIILEPKSLTCVNIFLGWKNVDQYFLLSWTLCAQIKNFPAFFNQQTHKLQIHMKFMQILVECWEGYIYFFFLPKIDCFL